jgi:hypothetical protein
MYGLDAQHSARKGRGLQRWRGVRQGTFFHQRERHRRKGENYSQFKASHRQLWNCDARALITYELRMIACVGIVLVHRSRFLRSGVLVMTGRLLSLRLVLLRFRARFQRARRETLGVKHHQNQRDKNQSSFHALLCLQTNTGLTYGSHSNYLFGILQGLCHTVHMTQSTPSPRAMISLRVFLRLTAMDVCCGPPAQQ